MEPRSVVEASEQHHEDLTASQWAQYDSSDEGKRLLADLKAIKKWRNEVVEFVAEEYGYNQKLHEILHKIDDRTSELTACDISPDADEYLAGLQQWEKIERKQCMIQMIDHPMVAWILEATREKIVPIRKHFMDAKKRQKTQKMGS